MEQFLNTISNQKLWGAIIASVGVILIGFLLAKFKILKQEGKGVINQVVLVISLPALAFSGFMKTITIKALIEQAVILASAFAFYIVLCAISLLWVKFVKFDRKLSNTKIAKTLGGESVSESKALVIWMMLIFGSTTFFGLPIIEAVYGSTGVLAANIWNIPYRIFLYSLCFMLMSGLKFNKANFSKSLRTALLNPIVIATFLGLIFWLSQLIPGLQVEVQKKTYGWFELSKTFPAIERIFAVLRSLASPLIWITIGMTLATVPLKKAVTDKWVWIFVVMKLVLIPIIVLLMMLPLAKTGVITKEVASSMVVFAAVPPSTVVIAYSSRYKMNEVYSAQCSALSTLAAIVLMPLWIILLGVIF
ncbi:AEC family transporter [Mesomycoplasma molare]|uniref:AEC family transporter n=1 Tax=Mesomycoplasma molare TaxID=171288 RepID=A0ABY5TW42_9BACT|nr:AEC family transporter [Mesomycoplasma molare]UWD34216.1 AEC family transporter [Mesomycoplasma molare]